MIYQIENNNDLPNKEILGGKAYNLTLLKKAGFNVPNFSVIPHTILEDIEKNKNEILQFINSLNENKLYAIRSSAIGEDGNEHSYAGQFTTELFVHKSEIYTTIKKVYASKYSSNIQAYQNYKRIESEIKLSIIVQEMIDSDVSGVAFGEHPIKKDGKTKVINSVFGLGEGLVSGKYDADEYVINGSEIVINTAFKPLQLVTNYKQGRGTLETEVPLRFQTMASLTNEQIQIVVDNLDKCANLFGSPQDIEFTFYAGRFYLLQSRPITTNSKEKSINKIFWDNSNIIESYPGVTTPLTYSFISRSYELAYKNFSIFMGVKEEVVKKHESVYKNTLGLLNGRVYYNLKTWYHMLAMLPGYSINARYMEKMMGVKETFDVPEDLIMSRNSAKWQVFTTVLKMIKRHQSLPKERTHFMSLVNDTISEYKAIDYDKKSPSEIIELYLSFESKLLDNWKAPLLNDFFAMIWFGLLQKECKKLTNDENTNLHNDLLCGSSDIISTQPIHRTIAIADLIRRNNTFLALFKEENDEFIFHLLQTQPSYVLLKKEVNKYIQEFGERCVGELKLETKSFNSQPSKFIKLLKSYLNNDIESSTKNNDLKIRERAELSLNYYLKNSPIKALWIKKVVNKTRELVSGRENLRYERSRAFGIVRELFSALGRKLSNDNVLLHEDDIFYLTREEILAYYQGRSVQQNLKALVSIRKEEFSEHKKLDLPSERVTTHGLVYHNNDFFAPTEIELAADGLKGIGCCPGIVRGKARVVLSPDEVDGLNGDILVTHSTDPGWVVLFPGASAIIVERGSLLSHSAIVSREMGKPCIVSITGLLKQIKTGDIIEINGSTGIIKIIERASEAITEKK